MDPHLLAGDLSAVRPAPPFAVAFDDGRSVAFANATLPDALFRALARRAAPGLPDPPRGVRKHTATVAGLSFHLLVGPGRVPAAALAGRFDLLARAEIHRLRAETDGMTGLANKTRFLDELERRFAAAASLAPRGDYVDPASAGGGSVALVLFDIDRFKRFNDDYGHLAGDHAIVAVARRLGEVARARGLFAARYGGEEFAAIASCDEAAGIDHAEAIRRAVADLSLALSGRKLPQVTVSLGVAAIQPASGEELRALPGRIIARADAALYAAKEGGRNRSERYRALRRTGRVVAAVTPTLALVLPGALHGACPGDVYRVIHASYDGRRNLEDPLTGKALGPSPLLVKGRVELVAPDEESPGSDRVSCAVARDLERDAALEPGDLLELDETRPAYPADDLRLRSLSLAEGSPLTACACVDALPAKGEFAVVGIPGLRDRVGANGRAATRDELARSRERLAAAGIDLRPLSSDKAVAVPRARGALARLPELLAPLPCAALTARCPEGRDEETLLAMKAALDAGVPHRFGAALEPFDDRVRLLLARACMRADRLAAAARALAGVRARTSRSFLNTEGALHLLRGDRDGALARFEKALSGPPDPHAFDDLMNLGRVAMELSDPARAAAAFRRAAALRPKDPRAANNLACALLDGGGTAAAALPLARRAVRLAGEGPAAPLFRETLAHALLRAGRPAEAAPILRELVELRPDCTDAHLHLIEAESALGDSEAAAAARARLARIRPEHPALAAPPPMPSSTPPPIPAARRARRSRDTEAPCI